MVSDEEIPARIYRTEDEICRAPIPMTAHIGSACEMCGHTTLVHNSAIHNRAAHGECPLCRLEFLMGNLEELVETYTHQYEAVFPGRNPGLGSPTREAEPDNPVSRPN